MTREEQQRHLDGLDAEITDTSATIRRLRQERDVVAAWIEGWDAREAWKLPPLELGSVQPEPVGESLNIQAAVLGAVWVRGRSGMTAKGIAAFTDLSIGVVQHCLSYLLRRGKVIRYDGDAYTLHDPGGATAGETATNPERAAVADPEPKPSEAADGEPAVDLAGSSSETKARQSAPAAVRASGPVSGDEQRANPVDAGEAGGSPAPEPTARDVIGILDKPQSIPDLAKHFGSTVPVITRILSDLARSSEAAYTSRGWVLKPQKVEEAAQ